jgi:RNA polymerase sigma-70 factor, ECF subfamily
VNSALQRARATAANGMPARSQQSVLRALGDERARDIVRRYSDAIEAGDADTLVSMLTEDVTWSMPPYPTWFAGQRAVRDWLVRDPLPLRWRHLPAWANGQLSAGCYLPDPERGGYAPAVIDVLTLDGERIAAVTGFVAVGPARPEAADGWAAFFARFGLPARLP